MAHKFTMICHKPVKYQNLKNPWQFRTGCVADGEA